MKKFIVLALVVLMALCLMGVSFAGDIFPHHNNKYDLGKTGKAWKSLKLGTGDIVVEGATTDDYQTTMDFAEPTADRTITRQPGGHIRKSACGKLGGENPA
jgi:hypothetical protein